MKLKVIFVICVLAVFTAVLFSGCAGEADEEPSEAITEVILN